MMAKLKKTVYTDYFLMLIGTALMAFVIKSIYASINLVTGGFSGVAILLKDLSGQWFEGGIPLWFTNLILNIPLFLIGIKVKGIRFLGRTLFGTLAISMWLLVLPEFSIVTDDLLLGAVFGGAISGVGIGLVFIARGTTGGTDMMAAIIQHYAKHYSIAQIMQVLDAAIVLIGVFVFGLERALYAVIAIFVVSQVSDGLLEGLKFSKVAFIITSRHREVANSIMTEMDRGVTNFEGTGMYSDAQRNMLFCVVSKKEIVGLKEIIMKIDPRAFVIVSDAREVLGEGFIEQKKKNVLKN
jgi:Uncharacterized conserved protein